MHIVHVLSSLNIGGAERFVLDLAKIQAEKGDKVAVFSCSSKEEALFSETNHADFVCRLSTGNIKEDRLIILDLLKGGDDAVLQLHSPWALRYFLSSLPLLFVKGVKIIYTRHGLNPLSNNRRWVLPHLFARLWVHWVTFVSQAGLEIFYKRFAWRKSCLVKISNGVYVPKAFEKTASDKIRIGSVGRMVALKGQKDLLAAVAGLDTQIKDRLELHFFGDGPERLALEQQSASLLHPEQVVFHGMVLDRDQVYGNIDVLVVSSEQEGLSLAIMEAMARNIPVIATNVGDSPKLVIDDETGFLYEYQDVTRLSMLIETLCMNAELISELGSTAREHMVENFSLEHANECYQKLYQS